MPEETDLSREALTRIGVDPDDLGYVGVKVKLPPAYKEALDPEWEYVSPTLKYVKGYGVDPHITLLYGLLFKAHENQDLIDDALAAWIKPNLIVLPEVEAFKAEDGHDLYSAIVLTLGTNQWDLDRLKEANDELRKLPHVNAFPVYKPHLTVGYVRRPFTDEAVSRMRDVEVRPLIVGDLDYGD